ncbi:DUF4135 domain-containing protein [Pseudomonas lini]
MTIKANVPKSVSEWIHDFHSLRRQHRLRGFPSLDKDYIVSLSRLQKDEEVLTENFVKNIASAIEHLPADIRTNPPSSMIDLGGDAHQGAFPILLQWPNGSRWIFKPRSAWPELALRKALKIIGEPLGLNWPEHNITECPQGSWWQVLNNDITTTPEKAAFFYFASGVLLACAYALRLSDLNHENIISVDGWPHVIDAEFILQPSLINLKNSEQNVEQRWFENSVLSTLMLPLPYRQDDPSGLGNAKGSNNACGRWTPSKHLPKSIYGCEYPALDYIPELLDGFSAGYKTIQNVKNKLIEIFPSNINSLIRIAMRPTVFYAEQEKWLWQKAFFELSSKNRHSAIYEKLINSQPKIRHLSILKSESSQLLSGSIPIFYAMTNKHYLLGPEKLPLCRTFPLTPLKAFKLHLQSLCDSDLKEQTSLIKLSIIGFS